MLAMLPRLFAPALMGHVEACPMCASSFEQLDTRFLCDEGRQLTGQAAERGYQTVREFLADRLSPSVPLEPSDG